MVCFLDIAVGVLFGYGGLCAFWVWRLVCFLGLAFDSAVWDLWEGGTEPFELRSPPIP